MIRVKLADATIRVGGDFQIQKDRVKSVARWNPASKTWESQKSLKEWFITPYDIEQGAEAGDHITRYGTHYSGPEWSALQETNKAKADISRQFEPRREALKSELRQRLVTIGISTEVIKRLAPMIQAYDLDDHVECGRIKFSTPERAEQVHAIASWYGEAIEKLTMDELDAQNAAEERLSDAFGIY